ncbi:MAG: precorrin-8X methylmutase [Rhodospirillaceae bacterium]
MTKFDYIRDPAEIYRKSFETIEAEADLRAFNGPERGMAVRLIHACGMIDLVDDLVFSGNPAQTGIAALNKSARVLVDAEMVSRGIIGNQLPGGNMIVCTLNNDAVAVRAEAEKTTRSAAQIDGWAPHLKDAVVAIGNAPTALFRLLELLDQGADRPAVILAFPVGFVGAAESKQALIDHAGGIPFATVKGRRGGSAMAAASVNAMGVGDPSSADSGRPGQ